MPFDPASYSLATRAYNAAIRKPPPFSKVYGAGHSFMAGFGLTSVNFSYLNLLAKMLHATPTNLSVASSEIANVLSTPTSATTQLFQNMTLPARTSGGWMPVQPLVILEAIINDAAINGSGAQAILGLKHGVRSAIAHSLLASSFEHTDASVAFAGSWGASSATTLWSGANIKPVGANGDTVTITVPATYIGTPIDIFVIGNATNNQGCVFTWTVDGVAAGSTDTRNQYSVATKFVSIVQRFTGLAAGTHTIVGTVSNFATSAWFDRWGVEAELSPTVLCLAEPRVIDQSAGPHTTYLTSRVPSNTALSDVVAEFASPYVQYVDILDGIMNLDPLNFQSSDNLHPSYRGAALIAEGLYDYLLTAAYDNRSAAAAA